MRVRWYGHSAFALFGAITVFIDPFADVTEHGAEKGFDYPPIEDIEAEIVLVTHDHFDHNGVKAIAGDPRVIFAAAGHFETPLGQVIGIASEHDKVAGIKLGANVIFVFVCDGLRVCHFGDFGQAELRPEQERAIGRPDLLFIPVGGEYTIDDTTAATITERLAPRLVIPMHYQNAKLDWGIKEVNDFLVRLNSARQVRLEATDFDPEEYASSSGTTVVVPAVP